MIAPEEGNEILGKALSNRKYWDETEFKSGIPSSLPTLAPHYIQGTDLPPKRDIQS